MTGRTPLATLGVLLILALVGCAEPQTLPTDAASPVRSADHGAVAEAVEVAEPQLHLVAIDRTGSTSMLDLLRNQASTLDRVTSPSEVTTDGRYVFAANDDGVEILDSGVWAWDHVDHFHYYRADARTIGVVPGRGIAQVSTGLLSTVGSTGLFFPTSGEAVLLDNAALAQGDIVETLRIDTGAQNGLVVPLEHGALVTGASSGSRADQLHLVGTDSEDDTETEDQSVACVDPAGSITTRVGVVVGCADGAVLATQDGSGNTIIERIEYPANAAVPATEFTARKGRPTVAGIGEDPGVWLLDTRAKSWLWIPSDVDLLAAAAVDDDAGHVVTVGSDGVVRVHAAETGELLAASDPLLNETLSGLAGDPELAALVTVTVDADRAYVNAPAEGVVYEIDFADDARIARVLDTGVRPDHLVEVGR
ncbi:MULTISPECIES: ABC transporter [unclassified Leucobacter]|uniref:ABC transporter n=1 Tax=unclassified Leucobacter TaxID=2621730 RepID=UPI00165E30ED|nr:MULTISPECIES: ABC transporter [unclassified Leucobacter]MBC9936236.1 ABC transporter [Leucobacter sp. cx-87]